MGQIGLKLAVSIAVDLQWVSVQGSSCGDEAVENPLDVDGPPDVFPGDHTITRPVTWIWICTRSST